MFMQDFQNTPHFIQGLNSAPYVSMSTLSSGLHPPAVSAGFELDGSANPMLAGDSDDDYAADMDLDEPADPTCKFCVFPLIQVHDLHLLALYLNCSTIR